MSSTGYIGGGKSTRLSVDGGATYQSGDLQLQSKQGVNLFVPSLGLIEADANLDPALAEVFSLYRSGQIAAGVLGTWSNGRSNGTAQLLAIEANFDTAQTTGDPANYYALQIAGRVGNTGSAVLPFNTAGARHYSTELQSGSVIAQPYKTANTPSRDNAHDGYLSQFVPTQNLSCTGFSWRGWLSTIFDSPGISPSKTIRGQLLDVNNNVLATSFVQSIDSSTDYTYAFSWNRPIVLTSGVAYRLGIDFWASNPNPGMPCGFGTFVGGTGQAAPITLDGANVWRTNALNHAVGFNAQWKDLFPGGIYSGNGMLIAGGGLWSGNTTVALLGAGGGATLRGDLDMSIIVVGAPPTTGAGTNLNARVLLG
jgi:hypothetical protein